MRQLHLLLLIICIFALTACNSLTDKVMGTWQAEDSQNGEPFFVTINKDSLVLEYRDSPETIDIGIDEKDGKVVLRQAGTENVIAVFTVRDDKKITGSFMLFGEQTFVAISEKDKRAITHPTVQNFFGYWAQEVVTPSGSYHTTYKIEEASLMLNNTVVPATVTAQFGGLLVKTPTTEYTFFIRNSSELSYHGQKLVKAKETELATFAKEREKAAQSIIGVWKINTEKQSSFSFKSEKYVAIPEFLEISADKVSYTQGVAEESLPVALDVGAQGFVFSSGKDTSFTAQYVDNELVTTGLVIRNGVKLERPSMFATRIHWIQSSAKEKDQQISAYKKLPEKMIGYWSRVLPEKGQLEALNITADVLTFNGKEYPTNLVHVRDNQYAINTSNNKGLYFEVKILDDNTLEMKKANHEAHFQFLPLIPFFNTGRTGGFTAGVFIF